MTVLNLNIPNDLVEELSVFKSDYEAVIIDAIREYLSLHTSVSEDDIEQAAIQDNSDDFLTPKELEYYLSLPSSPYPPKSINRLFWLFWSIKIPAIFSNERLVGKDPPNQFLRPPSIH